MGQDLGHSRCAASLWVGISFAVGLLLVGHLFASPQTIQSKHTATLLAHSPDIVFVQTPMFVAGPLAQRFPQGSAILRLNSVTPQSAPILLTDGFFAVADPQVNFDATKLMFAGKKAQNDRWQLWEVDLDGSHQHQITHCSLDCLRGAYLPAGEIAFTVEGVQGNQTASYLAVTKTDGTGFHPITFGNASFELETVLRDGRIVASAPWPLRSTEESGATRLLYTVRPDGTALESFRCDHRGKTIQYDAVELNDDSLLFVRRPGPGAAAGGELVQVKQGTPLPTTLGPQQALYRSPHQISKNELVVAKQTITATNSAGRFELYLLDLKTGATNKRLYADANAKLSSLQPVPVLAHAVPKHYWDTLDAPSHTGNFISLNSYLSSDETRGRISSTISRVRVFGLNPADGQERNLGEAPVESDGSFFVKVPANAPVRFVLLDAKGQVIREERGWVWTRPGEERGCTGCHGDKAVAPDNRWPLTLRRFDTPTPLGESEHGSATSQAK